MESVYKKVMKSVLFISGLAVFCYGLKDGGSVEEYYWIGPSLIIASVLTGFWNSDSLKKSLESKRNLIKVFELLLFLCGTAILCLGLRDKYGDAEEFSLWGGVVFGMSFAFRDFVVKSDQETSSNSKKILIISAFLAGMSFLASVYDHIESAEYQLDRIEEEVEYIER